MSFETAIQTTIYTALKADAPLSAVVVDVYDDVPQPTDTGDSSDFPYVTIGETVHSDWDTVTSVGDDATLTIHTWSRFAGRSEVKEIQGLIYDVLHLANLTLVGYNSVGLNSLS